MCGIAGALDLDARRDFPRERLARMCAALQHRGPNDEHHHLEPGLAMGTRRLALVDIGGGRQPLSNEDGSIWVSFNGELYEDSKLRQDLVSRGHTFATSCDTEIWPHWYEEHGDEIFDAAKGQFAVAIWDRARRRLTLGRDRIGICPLFYAEADGWLLWASEIKSLLASELIAPKPNRRAIDYIFCFGSAPLTCTFFEGVEQVRPGCKLVVDAQDGEKTESNYWDFRFGEESQGASRDDPVLLTDELERLLTQAVKRRLRGDVPVATYLSGGVDSTLVTALACRESGHPVPAFTIGLEGSRRDERQHAQETAQRLGCRLTEVTLDRRMIADRFPQLMLAAESPVVDTSCACMLDLASAVHRQGIRVVLTGEGADEALGGYPWNHLLKLRALPGFDSRYLSRLLGGRPLMQQGDKNRHRTNDYFAAGVRPVQLDFIEVIARGREALYSEEMWSQLAGHTAFDLCNLNASAMEDWPPLHQSAYLDYRIFLPGLLLSAKGDRSAMQYSVETRPPFLDEDVIDFCMRLHPSLKMRGRTEKWLLRQVASRLLPRKIAYRPKQGFRTSFAATFLSDDRPRWVDQLLSPESLAATGYFSGAGVTSVRQRFLNRNRWGLPSFTSDLSLTAVIATQLWHHMFWGGLCELSSSLSFESPHQLSLSEDVAVHGGQQ